MVALMLLLTAAASFAQTSRWEFRFGPRFWGASAAGRYTIEPASVEDVETSLTAFVSTAGESAGYYRLPDGSLYTLPVAAQTDAADAYDGIAFYRRYDLIWQLGVQQGLVPRDDATADRAIAFAFYRGQYDLPREEDEYSLFPGAANAAGFEELFFRSGRPEIDGSLRNSIVGGIAYSTVSLNTVTRRQAGVEAEVSLEWGPGVLNSGALATADYTRSTLLARGFVPLYQIEPVGSRNVLSAYLAGLAVVDWASGDAIPLEIRQTTGGRAMRDAPGGSVRGYASGRFDSTFKAIGNVEMRVNFPSLETPQIVPGLIVYTDAAYYHDTEALSPVPAENTGYLVSSGIGLSVYLDLVLAFDLVFYTNYLWAQPSYENASWIPFSLGFGLHY